MNDFKARLKQFFTDSEYRNQIKLQLYTIIFEADTAKGKMFDLSLILLIIISVAAVTASSIGNLDQHFGFLFKSIEWLCTIIFTMEYIVRIFCVPRRLKYIFSFYGIIDLLAILPVYISLFAPQHIDFLTTIRAIRIIRIFRILKMHEFLHEYLMLGKALKTSARKISVFLSVVFTVIVVIGALMYIVEGPENGFTSIPIGIYWAISTLSTVGFGDVTPHTSLGKFIASVMMLLGWGILAVPTGIVTVEMSRANDPVKPKKNITTRTCPHCLKEGLEADAKFCKNCGEELPEYKITPDKKS